MQFWGLQTMRNIRINLRRKISKVNFVHGFGQKQVMLLCPFLQFSKQKTGPVLDSTFSLFQYWQIGSMYTPMTIISFIKSYTYNQSIYTGFKPRLQHRLCVQYTDINELSPLHNEASNFHHTTPNRNKIPTGLAMSIPVIPALNRFGANITLVKGVWPDHLWIHSSKWSFWYQMKAPIFLINPVKSYGQQMSILKVTSENVAKVQKLL